MRRPQIIKSTPGNLKVTCTTRALARGSISNVAFTEFELLNSGESFAVEMLCTGQPQHPSVSCRIDGLKQVQVMTKEELERRKFGRFNSLMMVAMALLLVLSVALVVVFPDYSTFSAYVEFMSTSTILIYGLIILGRERSAK